MRILFAILMLAIVGCESGMDRQTAERLLQEAAALERSGDPVASYRKYKLVEGTYETNNELRSTAWDGAQRTRADAQKMAVEISNAVKTYREDHGSYPSKLADIAPILPARTAGALEGFHLYTQPDGDVIAEPSLVGHSFDLHNR